MKKNPVNWFEIPVTDMTRAKKFYSSLFESELFDIPMPGIEYAVFNMDEKAPGSSGALYKDETSKPTHDGLKIYFTTTDIEAKLAKAVELGGKVLLKKTQIGEHGFIGHFEDTEGNMISLHTSP